MRLISNEELVFVAGGASLEGGEECGDKCSDSQDGVTKPKPKRPDSSGGGNLATVSTPTGSGTVKCPFGTVPVISSSTTTTNGAGSGMMTFGTIAIQGSASGQGSGSSTTSKTEATCVPVSTAKKP